MVALHLGSISPLSQNSIQGSTLCKVRLSSGNKPQPQCAFAQQSHACLFSHSPLESIGQSGSGLPLAPWALMLCFWSPELETHSKRVLLRGEAGVGRKMPSGRRPQQSTQGQLGNLAPRPHLMLRCILHSGCCILERETLLGEQTTAPMRLCSAKPRLPFLP